MNSSSKGNLRILYLLFTIIIYPTLLFGQAKIKIEQGGVVVTDDNKPSPDNSAVLDVSSASKGVIFPKLSTATRDQIATPAEGLLIYNTDKKVYEFFNGTNWLEMGVTSESSSIDPDAQLVFDRMSGLTDQEKNAINDFIISEKAVGNYQLYDEFFLFPLGSSNGLIGFKSKTATAYGDITWDINGATFDGSTGYINTNWNASVDGFNYTLNNAQISFFSYSVGILGNGVCPMGVNSGSRSQIFKSSSTIGYAINTVTPSTTSTDNIESLSLYSSVREGVSSNKLYENGIIIDTKSVTSSLLPTNNIYFGATYYLGSDIGHADVTLSCGLIGAAIGFDHPAHNTNVRQLLTDLGLTL